MSTVCPCVPSIKYVPKIPHREGTCDACLADMAYLSAMIVLLSWQFPVFWFAFCSCNKILTESNLGREGLMWLTGFSPSLREVREGTQRRELKQKPWRVAVYWLASWGLLNCLSTYLPKAGSAHSGLGPVTSINNQGNAPTDTPTGQFAEADPLRFPLSGYVEVWVYGQNCDKPRYLSLLCFAQCTLKLLPADTLSHPYSFIFKSFKLLLVFLSLFCFPFSFLFWVQVSGSPGCRLSHH